MSIKEIMGGLAMTAAMMPMPETLPSKSPVSKGIIMPEKQYKRRQKRLSMQKRSRKANRK